MTTSTSTTTTVPPPPKPTIEQQVALCVAEVDAQQVLTVDEKATLIAYCQTAVTSPSPDSPAVIRARRAVCLTVVADSGVGGATAVAADRACEQIGAPVG